MLTKIFTITHKPFTPPKNQIYVPLQVGRACAEDLGYLGDDTGDSISSKNPYFCELTGMYWLWKNDPLTKIIGICHYRRYFINEDGAILTKGEILSLLEHYDILTSKLLTLPKPYYEGFSENHHEKDLLITGEVISKLYPEYFPLFDALIHDTHTYFGNLIITDKPTYDRYCSWLFSILFEVEKRTDLSGYSPYQKRLFGFLAEFLQTLWIRFHKLNVCECMIGMMGEKYETRTLKEQLAVFLEAGDYAAAKTHFLSCYQKRPDILMEASDVNGELKLCMQIISTCEFETEAYGSCILHRIHSYPALIRHFNQLNRIVTDYGNTFCIKDIPEAEFISLLTPLSIQIAVTLFFADDPMQDKICQELLSFLLQ